jgi:hypothetical protein
MAVLIFKKIKPEEILTENIQQNQWRNQLDSLKCTSRKAASIWTYTRNISSSNLIRIGVQNKVVVFVVSTKIYDIIAWTLCERKPLAILRNFGRNKITVITVMYTLTLVHHCLNDDFTKIKLNQNFDATAVSFNLILLFTHQ